MDPLLRSPGALVVVLRRHATSTDVLLFSDGSEEVAFPCAAARLGETQWALAEELLHQSRLEEVDPLYASAITVHREGVPYGVFVAFLDAALPEGWLPAETRWMDLREACRELAPLWSSPLTAVRECFVARSPDEALRVR